MPDGLGHESRGVELIASNGPVGLRRRDSTVPHWVLGKQQVTTTRVVLMFIGLAASGLSACSAPSGEHGTQAGIATDAAGAAGPSALAVVATGDSEQRPVGASHGCLSLLDTLAACAAQRTCDSDLTMYLPAAARGSLVAMEDQRGFSDSRFDAYCRSACDSQTAKVDERQFMRDVCGQPLAPVAAQDGVAPGVDPRVRPVGFLLGGDVQIGVDGVELSRVTRSFGNPVSTRSSSFECGSAFATGNVVESAYPGFLIESDGHWAVIRRVEVTAGHRLLLSDGQVLDRVQEEHFLSVFGAQADRLQGFYRVGESAGNWETAFDFHFSSGELTSVDLWIGC